MIQTSSSTLHPWCLCIVKKYGVWSLSSNLRYGTGVKQLFNVFTLLTQKNRGLGDKWLLIYLRKMGDKLVLLSRKACWQRIAPVSVGLNQIFKQKKKYVLENFRNFVDIVDSYIKRQTTN